MARCKVAGCSNDAGINPKTGRPNTVCMQHYLEAKGTQASAPNSPKKFSGVDKEKGPRRKQKTSSTAPRVELFVLRGHTLTINYTGKTEHFEVNRLTRAVIYNDDKEGRSGKVFHYIIDVKQGVKVIANILFDSKRERDREFAKLQALLSTL
jgi:hypothetical protein